MNSQRGQHRPELGGQLAPEYGGYIMRNIQFRILYHNCDVFALPLTVRLGEGLEFIMSSPEPKPNRITDDEDKNQSPIELRQAGA